MILENHSSSLFGAQSKGKVTNYTEKAAHEIRGAGFFSLILR